MIDYLYNEIDKNYFYIGRISQVYRDGSIAQVENLSLLSHRKLMGECLYPSTINYLVVIDSVRGLFLGEVYQNKVLSSDNLHESINKGKSEVVFPEIGIDVIGLMPYDTMKFELPEFLTVGVADKVYLANEKIIHIYLESMEITTNDEKVLSPFAAYLNGIDEDVELKPSTLFSHHLMTVGATNSGKSTSALSILDKIVVDKKKVLIIDPTGEYKDSFSNTEINKLTLGIDTAISPGKISMQQWAMLFETNSNTQGAVLAEAIHSLRYQRKTGRNDCLTKDGQNIAIIQQQLSSITKADTDFDISLLPQQIAAESVSQPPKGSTYIYDTFKANVNNYLVVKVTYQLGNTNFLTFFSQKRGMKDLLCEINDFLQTPKSSLYVDASLLGATDGIGGMIIDLISNYVINQDNINPFVYFIDEVHRYTKSQYSESEFYNGLTLVAREGRKKGIFLFLTTQNPQDVSPILLGQVGTLLVHRLMHNDEIRAIQNHLDDYSIRHVRKLNQGEAILTSVNLLKNIIIRVYKSDRKQYNETPSL